MICILAFLAYIAKGLADLALTTRQNTNHISAHQYTHQSRDCYALAGYGAAAESPFASANGKREHNSL